VRDGAIAIYGSALRCPYRRSRSKGRCRDDGCKNYRARRKDRCGEMERAHIRPADRPSLLPADTEGEASFRFMGVDRQCLPAHAVGALRQRLQSNAHGVAADLGLALVDARAGQVIRLNNRLMSALPPQADIPEGRPLSAKSRLVEKEKAINASSASFHHPSLASSYRCRRW
jgi:hypothetical protein